MNRNSLAVRIGRKIQNLPLSFLRWLEAPILTLNRNKEDPFLIIVLALPRSGSTLTYQVLIHSINSIYLSNGANLLYQLPLIGSSLSKLICKNYSSNFSSERGFVSGGCGPAEGLKFWSYWFANGIDERINFPISDRKLARRIKYLKKSLSILSSPYKPYVTGYLGHVLDSERLKDTFPDAIFVRLHRDPVNNALSLYNNRAKDKTKWFSVFPKECQNYINKTPHEQVAAQVYWLNKRLNSFNSERMIDIQYEELCMNPKATITKIIKFCNDKGYMLEQEKELPNKFNLKSINHEKNLDARLIKKAIKQLEDKHGAIIKTH